MRKLSDHIKYYWEKMSKSSHNFLFRVLSALSFLMMFFYFGYIVYYSTMCYDISRVITGCLALCVMIHLNKSLY